MLTYAGNVREDHHKKREACIKNHVGKYRHRFGCSLTACKAGKMKRNSKRPITDIAAAGTKRRKLNAYNLFLREEAATMPKAQKPLERTQAAMEKWKNADPSRKQELQATAEAQTTNRDKILHVCTFPNYCEAKDKGLLPNGKMAQLHQKRQALAETVRQLRADPVWSAGTRVSDFNGPIKESLIVDCTDEVVTSENQKLFTYSENPIINPPGKMSVPEPCAIAMGGLCQEDAHASRIQKAVQNCCKLFTTHRVAFPAYVTIAIDERPPWHYLVTKPFKRHRRAHRA